MTLKFLAAKTLVALLSATALLTVGLGAPDADAQVRRYQDNSVNSSYMSGPRTRVFVTKRSWLDAGTEVLPGERKFSDYAFPPGQSFGTENRNRPFDRQPLSNTPLDLGGYPERFPLY